MYTDVLSESDIAYYEVFERSEGYEGDVHRIREDTMTTSYECS